MSNIYSPPETSDGAQRSADVEHKGLPLASRWIRLAGAIIDGFAVGIPTVILSIVVFGIDSFTPEGQEAQGVTELVLGAVLGIVVMVLIQCYFIYTRGQTLAKVMLGMRVVTLDGKQVSGNRYLFVRLLPFSIVFNIPLVGGIIGLVNALLIFRKEKNCLHDDVAGTRVISLNPSPVNDDDDYDDDEDDDDEGDDDFEDDDDEVNPYRS